MREVSQYCGAVPDDTPSVARPLTQPNQRWLGDHGDADPAVREALRLAGAAQPDPTTGYLRAVVALGGARLLMPIVADGDDSMEGPDPDRHAEMAAVSLTNATGERALLAFTGLDALTAWNSSARPVPGTLDDVAATVAEAGSDVLLLDVAGPTPFVVGQDLLVELARGRRLVELEDGGFGWAFAQTDDEDDFSPVE